MARVETIGRVLTGRTPWDRTFSYAEKVTYDSTQELGEYYLDGKIVLTSIVKERTLIVGTPIGQLDMNVSIRRKINALLTFLKIGTTITSRRKVLYWSDGKKYNGPRVFTY